MLIFLEYQVDINEPGLNNVVLYIHSFKVHKMKNPKQPVTATIGILTTLWSIASILFWQHYAVFVPFFIGLSLIYLGFYPGRLALLIFGHLVVVVGCYLTTWGIYLLPHSEPTVAHIFGRPLFWGLFSTFGGICAIYHGFCRCITSGSKSPELQTNHID